LNAAVPHAGIIIIGIAARQRKTVAEKQVGRIYLLKRSGEHQAVIWSKRRKVNGSSAKKLISTRLIDTVSVVQGHGIAQFWINMLPCLRQPLRPGYKMMQVLAVAFTGKSLRFANWPERIVHIGRSKVQGFECFALVKFNGMLKPVLISDSLAIMARLSGRKIWR
jgi:hypothetical protein